MLQMRYFYISVPLIAGNLGPLTGTRVIIGTAAARAALHIYISVCSIYLCPNSGIWLSASAWIFFFFFFFFFIVGTCVDACDCIRAQLCKKVDRTERRFTGL